MTKPESAGVKIGEISTCAICGAPPFKFGPVLYRVTLEQHSADVRALRDIAGLEVMLGSVELARVLSQTETVTVRMTSTTALLCAVCFLRADDVLPRLLARGVMPEDGVLPSAIRDPMGSDRVDLGGES